ncbi:MAG: hemolysin family protein [Chloroflexota bacterium]
MLEIGFILLLILANGFFAAAEMAFVTARPTKLRTLADQGNKSAERVLNARQESSDFLAMIQIGTTLVATLASAVGGASTARLVAPLLEPVLGTYSENVALGIIVLIITYVTLVVGELVPKQFAMQNAERIAMAVIQPLNILQRVFWLPIKLLDISIGAITRLFGESEDALEFESPEEIAMIVQQAASDGVIDQREEDLITRVFDYAEASLADIMTPRPNIVSLQCEQTVDEARQLSVDTGFSRFIVIEDELDQILGYLHIKDLLMAEGEKDVKTFVREIIILPETLKVPPAFNRLIRSDAHLAIVIDEFGSVAGLVTMEDMLEEIVGEIEDEYSLIQPTVVRDGEHGWLLDGATSLLDLRNSIGIELPETGEFNTIAGYFLHVLGAVPNVGDFLIHKKFKMTIEEMEGYRIAQIRILDESINQLAK